MNDIFRKSVNRAICFFAIFLCIFSLLPAVSAKGDQKQFSLKLDYAFGGSAQTGYYAPFNITVTNNGSDFEGTITLTTAGTDNDIIAYEQPLSLTSGATKTCRFISCPFSYDNEVNIRISTNKGKELLNENVTIQLNNNSNVANIGILTDDYAALSYLSGQFFKASGTALSLYRLDADTLPDNYNGLDMIDAIIISNFPTDSLSTAQINALIKWVNAGGLLIIGTGDSAGKTLSGFNGILSVPTNGLKKIKTTYGLSNVEFEYDYDYNYNNYREDYINNYPNVSKAYSLIDFSKYIDENVDRSAVNSNNVNMFTDLSEQIYDDYKDIIKQYCWDTYYGDDYETFKKYSDPDSDNHEMYFRNHAIDELIPSLISEYITKNFSLDSKEVIPIEGQICEFSFGDSLIECDSDDGTTYPFASYTLSGDGSICVLAVDLTKSPFIDFSGNKDIVIHIIETLAGNNIVERLQNYGWRSGNSILSGLLNRMTAQKLTPALLYIVILLSYIVFSLVMFFILKKKGKSMLIWPLQAGFALGGSLLIFLLGFSTRVTGTSVNTVRIISKVGETASESDYVTVTMPKVKHYSVPFKSNYNVSDAGESSGYYYGSSSQLSKADYTICFSEAPEGTVVKFNNIVAMNSKYFSLENKDTTSPDITFDCNYYNGKLSGTITNNSDKTLRDSFVCVDLAVFKVDKITPGETIDLSSLEGTSLLKLDLCDSSRLVMKDPDELLSGYKVGPDSILFGLNNQKFRKEFDKVAIINYLKDSILNNYLGFGNQYEFFSIFQNGQYASGHCIYLNKYNNPGVTPESLGINSDGFIETSYAEPLFIGFTDKPEAVTKGDKDSVAEVIILSKKNTDSLNPQFDAYLYNYIY